MHYFTYLALVLSVWEYRRQMTGLAVAKRKFCVY